MDFVFTIIAGLLLGWGFDRWRGTEPWGVLAGLAVGFTAAFFVILRQSAAEERAEKARKAARQIPQRNPEDS
jgi:F0F1-type ATP synthase assembly protein I